MHFTVTPQRDCLATPQRELTRKNLTVRFNIILLMRYGLYTRIRRHIQLQIELSSVTLLIEIPPISIALSAA